MKITVTSGTQVWNSPDGKVKIYDIVLENGSKLQTMSGKIAQGGTFDVEVYEKNGRQYARQLATEQQAPGGAEKQFKADPASRESIEWQTSLKAAVEVVRDWHATHSGTRAATTADLEEYCKLVDMSAVHFKNLITLKPTSTVTNEPVADDELVPPAKQIAFDPEQDLPPVENYEEDTKSKPYDDIPF